MVNRISLLIALGAGAVVAAAALVDCSHEDSSALDKPEGQPMARPDPIAPTTPPPLPTPSQVPAPHPTVPRPGPTDTGDPGPPSLTR